MTCIVAMEHDGEVTLGYDAMASNGHSRGRRLDPKAWSQSSDGTRFVIGATTSYRMLQVLRFHAPPVIANQFVRGWDGDRWLRWMVTNYVPNVRKELKEAELTKIENGVESAGSWLVGIQGGYLFNVADDFQVARYATGFDAIGSGAMVALGALDATAGLLGPDGQPLTVHQRLERALLAAEEHAAGVGAPFHIISTARSTT